MTLLLIDKYCRHISTCAYDPDISTFASRRGASMRGNRVHKICSFFTSSSFYASLCFGASPFVHIHFRTVCSSQKWYEREKDLCAGGLGKVLNSQLVGRKLSSNTWKPGQLRDGQTLHQIQVC